MVRKLFCSTSSILSTVYFDISLFFVQLGLENFGKIVRDSPPFIIFARVQGATVHFIYSRKTDSGVFREMRFTSWGVLIFLTNMSDIARDKFSGTFSTRLGDLWDTSINDHYSHPLIFSYLLVSVSAPTHCLHWVLLSFPLPCFRYHIDHWPIIHAPCTMHSEVILLLLYQVISN